MFSLESLRDLFGHMEWADTEVWSSVFESSAAANDAVIRDRLRHIHLTQRFFLAVWMGEAPDFSEIKAEPALEAIHHAARDYYETVNPFLEGLNEILLSEPIEIPWASRFAPGAKTVTLGETMFQVTSHSTYHRGQVNARLREVGGTSRLVDYIAWLWSGRPRPERNSNRR